MKKKSRSKKVTKKRGQKKSKDASIDALLKELFGELNIHFYQSPQQEDQKPILVFAGGADGIDVSPYGDGNN